MDSFKRYRRFCELIIQPINNIIAEHEDFKDFQNLLKIHSNFVKQEIVVNCRRHTRIEVRADYRSKILSELRALNKTLLRVREDDFMEDQLNYPYKQKKIYTIEIVNILEDIKHLILQINPTPQKVNFTSTKLQNSSFKLIPGILKDDIIDVCNKLKQIKNLTIDSNTDPEAFWKCFSGEKVIIKVSWLRKNVLRYFITELANADLMVSTDRIWKIAANCFVYKNGKSNTNIELGKITPLKNKYIIDRMKPIIESLKDKRDSNKKTR
jgi:hypothetical protein